MTVTPTIMFNFLMELPWWWHCVCTVLFAEGRQNKYAITSRKL